MNIDATWWIVAVVMPLVGALAVLVWRYRSDTDDKLDEMGHRIDFAGAQLREALAFYKLEVAKSYATVGTLKDVERRLTEHLIRIEAKLDAINNRAA